MERLPAKALLLLNKRKAMYLACLTAMNKKLEFVEVFLTLFAFLFVFS